MHGTTPYMHSAVTMSALEAGKHVFSSGAHVHGSGRGRGNARCFQAISRVGDDVLSAAFRTTRRFNGQKNPRRKLHRPAASRAAAKFPRKLPHSDSPAHWRQKIEISGLNTLTLGIYIEVLQRWLGDITGVFAREKIIQPLREAYNVIVPDLLTVLCSFESGAEGVLEFSGVHRAEPEVIGWKFTAAPGP